MTHLVALDPGFVPGIYALPILIAPDGPTDAELEQAMSRAAFSSELRRDLKGGDFPQWGEGRVTVCPEAVSRMGSVAPGPDCRVYLTPEFVEDEERFWRVKTNSVGLGAARTFEHFIVPIPPSINAFKYNTVAVWCEVFFPAYH